MLHSIHYHLQRLQQRLAQKISLPRDEIKDIKYFLAKDFAHCIVQCLADTMSPQAADSEAKELALSPMGLMVTERYNSVKYTFYTDFLKKLPPETEALPQNTISAVTEPLDWPARGDCFKKFISLNKHPIDETLEDEKTTKKMRIDFAADSPPLLSRKLTWRKPPSASTTTSPIMRAQQLSLSNAQFIKETTHPFEAAAATQQIRTPSPIKVK